MLRTYLESHDPSAGYVLQKCVAKKLLSMGSQLPQWLVDKYKVRILGEWKTKHFRDGKGLSCVPLILL